MSTQASHTPGEWIIDARDVVSPCVIRAGRRPKNRTDRSTEWMAIAECFGPSPTREANARLIAAAPELLQLLGDLGQWLETHLAQGNINAGTVNRDGEFVSQIRAVIAKATGKAQP